MKVELAVPSPTDGGDGMRESRGQATSLCGWSSERGSDGLISTTSGGGTGRPCDSLLVVPGCRGTFDDVAFEKMEEISNVKFELGVCSPSPLTSDTW